MSTCSRPRTLLRSRFMWAIALLAVLATHLHAAPPRGAREILLKLPNAPAQAGGIELPIALPADNSIDFELPDGDWTDLRTLRFDVAWPDSAPTNAQVLVYMKDWDHYWFQSLLPGYLVPGELNEFSVDLRPEAAGQWEGRGHRAAWHFRVLQKPKLFGVRIFGQEVFNGACLVTNAYGVLRNDTTPPFIRSVRTNTRQVKCFDKFEVTFNVPDRYVDPFDADEVRVTGVFRDPDGIETTIDGYYGIDYFRTLEATGERIVPQGTPYWRVRFSPLKEGQYTFTLNIQDQQGQASWGPAGFSALPAERHGFVRVSRTDPRYFEFTDGAPFFPIGHNIRSPNDTRVERNFPWMQRWPEGSASYRRRFVDMRAHGENFAEIWCASWSLGLEWHPDWRGYRGIGLYNMMHAWEFDRIVDAAEETGVHIGLVIHNHGKFSTFCDPEWQSNPFNKANGGYLSSPNQYFTDPRALAAFRKLMRYRISRWAYSPNLVSWQLWSELDLAGDRSGFYQSQEVVDWHKLMGGEVKAMDPYDHLIATHTCGDYTHQNMAINRLPEIDFCPVDAYHGESDPLHIVTLIRLTVENNNPLNKPVLITEFGGTAMAQGLKHLVDALHAALWTSTCTPIGGTPLFWWWHLIEEEQLYPMFDAVSRFLAGEDRRDPMLKSVSPSLRLPEGHEQIRVHCMSNGSRANGWMYDADHFDELDPDGDPGIVGVTLSLPNMNPMEYRVEFWNTGSGTCTSVTNLAPERGSTLAIAVPPFARDVAFKIMPAVAPEP